MTGDEILELLKASGWLVLRQQGSHIRLGKGALKTTVPLHRKRDIKLGTLTSIERQIGFKLK